MTRDEILNIPAGREIDTIILRDILKYKPVYVQEGALFGTVGELDCWYDEGGMFVPLGTSPSNDISTAWKVVEKMKENPDVGIALSDYSSGGFCFTFFGPGMFEYEGDAETVPLAICRAALLAVAAV